MKVSIVMMFTTFNLILAACSYGDIPAGKAGAVFAVHCYTVGEHALQGQAGVISVEPGWSGPREVDRVIYDPEKISVEQMEDLLRQAGTYRQTLEVTLPRSGQMEGAQ